MNNLSFLIKLTVMLKISIYCLTMLLLSPQGLQDLSYKMGFPYGFEKKASNKAWSITPGISNKEKEVEEAINAFKSALINTDSAKLVLLTAEDLSYEHSNGRIENKAAFIQSVMSRHSVFISIDISEQTIKIYSKTAVVRHRLDAILNDNGMQNKIKLSALEIWIKQAGNWKMVARQAVKL
jgi:hypothetical protein